MNSQLGECLERFRELANDNQRISRLIHGWRRSIHIAPTDAPMAFAAQVDGAIGAWRPIAADAAEDGAGNDGGSITLCAPASVLTQVFTGELNPARAHLDGTLQVFAEDRDQVKLDAISLILWGA